MIRSVIVLMSITLLCSCRKNIEAGIRTTITGSIRDSLRNLPIAGGKLYVMEYEKGCFICRPRPRGYIDSTFSGSDGNYSLTFTTTGAGYMYEVDFVPPDDYYGSERWEVNVGKDTSVDLYATRYSILKASIKMDAIPNPPLVIRSTYLFHDLYVHSFPADTVVDIPVLPLVANSLMFFYGDADSIHVGHAKDDPVSLDAFAETYTRSFVLDSSMFTRTFSY